MSPTLWHYFYIRLFLRNLCNILGLSGFTKRINDIKNLPIKDKVNHLYCEQLTMHMILYSVLFFI